MQRGSVAVVIPAAGSGSRMGGVPKQFRLLGEAPVLVQTLRAFEEHSAVDRCVVATAEAEVAVVEAMLASYGLAARVVPGGATRQDSVGQGLAALPDGVDVVLVHDAVRPFIGAERITAVIEASREHEAAALAVPVADTLRRGEAGHFSDTVDRTDLWRMQTPQAARLDLLRQAHRQARAEGFCGTDEVEVLQRAGHAVRLVEGDAHNLKLTHPGDWEIAEVLWAKWEREHGRRGEQGKEGTPVA
ncbi:MAG: 2-C-methyl-D-erythritol 4-phosphate cytidylyltransferase [Rhodothermaceae bacterium]|nr:2-C-methyl-D-erythritol 4-phosphate cytidylyltransferase [Rhodothermaceae bacterium]